MRVLVAGGAGYIGSHTARRLLAAGHHVVLYDNLSRGHVEVGAILGLRLVVADLADRDRLESVLREEAIDAVMHFAAHSLVGESVVQPLLYYRNNVATTITLLETMREVGVDRMVFSSTCAVYGDPEHVPIAEDAPRSPVSPYGRSKLMVEQVLEDLQGADPSFRFASLRYFNACGCAADGSLGEDHRPETHLIPVIMRTALGRRDRVDVFGDDYPTADGTCIRDYIHVDDLADAHIAALLALDRHPQLILNLGTGRGYSVWEILRAAERVSGKRIPVLVGPRRPGDAVSLYADSTRARQILDWEPVYKDPEPIIETAWRWFREHPNGYSP